MMATFDQAAGTRARALRLLMLVAVALAAPVIVVAVGVGLLAGGGVVAVAVAGAGLVIGAGTGAAVTVTAWRTAEARVLDRLGGRPADPVVHARLFNLVEGLCAGAGLPRPQLFIIVDDAPNGLALGRDPRHGALVVTEGLLDTMTRIELEGVLAHLLCRLRDGQAAAATVAVSLAVGPFGRPLGGLLRSAVRAAHPPGWLTDLDRAATSLTRYPPGLLSALERIRAAGPGPTSGSDAVVAALSAPLWLRPPASSPGAGSLDERIEALAEL